MYSVVVDAPDAILIQRSRSGDLAAFDALMARYQGLVFTVAFSCVRNRDEALDISQNAFLRAYERLGSLRDEGRFRFWIARIAQREGINWVRRHRRHGETVDAAALQIPDSAPSQEARLLAGEGQARLMDRLGCLNRRYRLAVSLRYVEGMSTTQIAAVLRCSEGVVKNILFRSVRRLRQELMGERHVS